MGSPVSPIVADIFIEFLEQSAIASVPAECKPMLRKRYVDDILEVIKKHGVDGLTQHLNSVDDTGSIKFTAEQEQDEQMPFIDSLIVRKTDGRVKLLVYRKKTHTDQYLQFSSDHPLTAMTGTDHKISVNLSTRYSVRIATRLTLLRGIWSTTSGKVTVARFSREARMS